MKLLRESDRRNPVGITPDPLHRYREVPEPGDTDSATDRDCSRPLGHGITPLGAGNQGKILHDNDYCVDTVPPSEPPAEDLGYFGYDEIV